VHKQLTEQNQEGDIA